MSGARARRTAPRLGWLLLLLLLLLLLQGRPVRAQGPCGNVAIAAEADVPAALLCTSMANLTVGWAGAAPANLSLDRLTYVDGAMFVQAAGTDILQIRCPLLTSIGGTLSVEAQAGSSIGSLEFHNLTSAGAINIGSAKHDGSLKLVDFGVGETRTSSLRVHDSATGSIETIRASVLVATELTLDLQHSPQASLTMGVVLEQLTVMVTGTANAQLVLAASHTGDLVVSVVATDDAVLVASLAGQNLPIQELDLTDATNVPGSVQVTLTGVAFFRRTPTLSGPSFLRGLTVNGDTVVTTSDVRHIEACSNRGWNDGTKCKCWVPGDQALGPTCQADITATPASSSTTAAPAACGVLRVSALADVSRARACVTATAVLLNWHDPVPPPVISFDNLQNVTGSVVIVANSSDIAEASFPALARVSGDFTASALATQAVTLVTVPALQSVTGNVVLGGPQHGGLVDEVNLGSPTAPLRIAGDLRLNDSAGRLGLVMVGAPLQAAQIDVRVQVSPGAALDVSAPVQLANLHLEASGAAALNVTLASVAIITNLTAKGSDQARLGAQLDLAQVPLTGDLQLTDDTAAPGFVDVVINGLTAMFGSLDLSGPGFASSLTINGQVLATAADADNIERCNQRGYYNADTTIQQCSCWLPAYTALGPFCVASSTAVAPTTTTTTTTTTSTSSTSRSRSSSSTTTTTSSSSTTPTTPKCTFLPCLCPKGQLDYWVEAQFKPGCFDCTCRAVPEVAGRLTLSFPGSLPTSWTRFAALLTSAVFQFLPDGPIWVNITLDPETTTNPNTFQTTVKLSSFSALPALQDAVQAGQLSVQLGSLTFVASLASPTVPLVVFFAAAEGVGADAASADQLAGEMLATLQRSDNKAVAASDVAVSPDSIKPTRANAAVMQATVMLATQDLFDRLVYLLTHSEVHVQINNHTLLVWSEAPSAGQRGGNSRNLVVFTVLGGVVLLMGVAVMLYRYSRSSVGAAFDTTPPADAGIEGPELFALQDFGPGHDEEDSSGPPPPPVAPHDHHGPQPPQPPQPAVPQYAPPPPPQQPQPPQPQPLPAAAVDSPDSSTLSAEGQVVPDSASSGLQVLSPADVEAEVRVATIEAQSASSNSHGSPSAYELANLGSHVNWQPGAAPGYLVDLVQQLLAYAQAGFSSDLEAWLLELEADVRLEVINYTDPDTRLTVLRVLTSRAQYFEAAFLLLKFGVNVNAPADPSRRTVLHYAALDNLVPLTQYLLSNNALVDLQDTQGRTALMYACELNHVHVVRLLLEHGANQTLRDIDGMTAATFAAMGGSVEVLQLLDPNAALPALEEPRHFDAHGRTPLHWAAAVGCPDAIELLMRAEPPMPLCRMNHRDTHGMTPLHLAAINGDHASLQLLLTKCPKEYIAALLIQKTDSEETLQDLAQDWPPVLKVLSEVSAASKTVIANHQRARNMKFSADEDTSNDSDSTNHKKQPRRDRAAYMRQRRENDRLRATQKAEMVARLKQEHEEMQRLLHVAQQQKHLLMLQLPRQSADASTPTTPPYSVPYPSPPRSHQASGTDSSNV